MILVLSALACTIGGDAEHVSLTTDPGVADAHAGHDAGAEPKGDGHAGHGIAAEDEGDMPGTPGMKPAGHEAHAGRVEVSPDAEAALGIRTVVARAGVASIPRRAPASVAFDATVSARITVQTGGQVRRLDLPRVGERVRAGAVVARIYQPELRAAFEELLLTRAADPTLLDAARGRLLASGVDPRDVDAAIRSGAAPDTVPVRAPSDGVVTTRPVAEGVWLAPGGALATIADARVVDMVVSGDVPGEGTLVSLTDGAATWSARVAEALPTAQAAGVDVRLVVEGSPPVGRPLTATWTEPGEAGVWVPRGALVDTGERTLVFVRDQAEGPFVPRPVRVGVRTPTEVQVLEGVEAGEEVVSAGTFLFDADTQMGSGGGHAGHGS